MAQDYHWLTTLGLVTSSLIAVTANSLLLPVFFRRRGLRTVSNRFVINLLITNLLSSVFLVPLLIFDDGEKSSAAAAVKTALINATVENGTSKLFVSEKDEEEIIVEEEEEVISLEIVYEGADSSGFLCYFAQTTTSLICTTSIFGILLIGVDQYFAVVHSLRYHSYIDKCRSTMLLAGCWLFSVALALLGASVSADSNFWGFCGSARREASALRTVYSCGYFVVVILLPFATICVIYVCIYTAAHKNSERMRKSTSANISAASNSYAQLPVQIAKESSEESLDDKGASRTLPKVHSAPNFINLEDIQREKSETKPPASPGTKVSRSSSERTTGKNIIVSLKSRISNASVFRYREETRAAKISILVIFMVLICYAPYGLAVLLHGSRISFGFDRPSLVLLVISNIVSPFLFAYRNRRVQRELFRFLRLIPAKSPQQSACTGRSNRTSGAGGEGAAGEPFLNEIPKVVVECRAENEKKSILKRVCSKNWGNYKKCNFITVPDSCLDTRGSFSSASTQISTEE